MYQLLSAVHYLHLRGIIHKRIGKGWISFSGSDAKLSINRDCSVLSDFDYLKSDKFKVDVARSEIHFNAPEYLKTNQICVKYDIWCLGWYLFNICTLQNPFKMLNAVTDFKNWNKVSISSSVFKTDLVNLFQK